MKSFLMALCGLLLGWPMMGRAQVAQPGPVRLPYRSGQTGDALEVRVDSVDFIKATAINEAGFRNFSGQAFVGLGYAAARYGGLNDLLRQAGFPQVDNGQFGYGGAAVSGLSTWCWASKAWYTTPSGATKTFVPSLSRLTHSTTWVTHFSTANIRSPSLPRWASPTPRPISR
ncbi:hypothetical protein [Hymenobacter cellulosilyticus]|uniref:Uncharacterized protein n=1 Tax=Hymenobacter cellulosilyticus TaxID=2932248 RepID=A0A8T9QAQ6_9BACT|nr:hypothetical protein [Hymenobacter cellulosilyticus]UOQ74646.1 hypothetical protein MUN79_12705 [Hymenobacter cellulosilyticus]